jgi:hypothetical protein
LCAFLISPLCGTYPTHLILLDMITLILLVKRTNYEAPHYAALSSLLSLPPKYSP